MKEIKRVPVFLKHSVVRPHSGSAKCYRFGHRLTLCTLNILFTCLLTYLCVGYDLYCPP